jgi:hypothetical protein
MRVPTCVLACLLGALALVGCDDVDPEDASMPVAAVRLPDDLCAVVPASAVTRWRLLDDDHATERGEDRSKARCTMSGRVDESPVTLEVTLTSYGARDRDALRELLADELAARCGALEATGEGRFTDTDRRCSQDQRGRVTEVSLSTPSQGVLTVSMAYDGPQRQLLGAEVVGISGTIANGVLTPRSGARRS